MWYRAEPLRKVMRIALMDFDYTEPVGASKVSSLTGRMRESTRPGFRGDFPWGAWQNLAGRIVADIYNTDLDAASSKKKIDTWANTLWSIMCRRDLITDKTADQICCSLGLHPLLVWDEEEYLHGRCHQGHLMSLRSVGAQKTAQTAWCVECLGSYGKQYGIHKDDLHLYITFHGADVIGTLKKKGRRKPAKPTPEPAPEKFNLSWLPDSDQFAVA